MFCRDPVMVPVFDPVMVPIREPVMVPDLLDLDPVMVPPQATAESAKINMVEIRNCPERFILPPSEPKCCWILQDGVGNFASCPFALSCSSLAARSSSTFVPKCDEENTIINPL